MKLAFCIIALTIFSTSCNKDKDNGDVDGDRTISGKVYIRNVYEGPVTDIPAASQMVYIKYAQSSINDPATYLRSTKTDSAGNYLFDYLRTDLSYRLFSELTYRTRLDNNIFFSNMDMKDLDRSADLYLQPDTLRQYGLLFRTQDMYGGQVPEDSIYLYTSYAIAVQDTTDIKGTGANYSFTTNTHGNAFKMHLPKSGKLYINTAKTVGSIRLVKRLDSVTVLPTGFDIKEIIVR